MTIDHQTVHDWLDRLKSYWEAGDGEGALSLFRQTAEYYERPFHAGTTEAEIRKYWEDVDGLKDITFEFEIVAIAGQRAVVHWQNGFVTPDDGKAWLLDGVFFIDFDVEGECQTFRQWWFARD